MIFVTYSPESGPPDKAQAVYFPLTPRGCKFIKKDPFNPQVTLISENVQTPRLVSVININVCEVK